MAGVMAADDAGAARVTGTIGVRAVTVGVTVAVSVTEFVTTALAVSARVGAG